MTTNLKFIIVDDDPFNNRICSMIIKGTLGEADIQSFTLPEEALSFIQDEYSEMLVPAILFLDINMPTLTGWEFLEKYEDFNEKIKQKITIYILSSSIDQPDKDKADANKYIKDFISKPLNRDAIRLITENKILELGSVNSK